ncbi:MAG: FAD-dependent oxidoreductase [Armatimonadetes bacterium]|nr:FAD-dependent oxidoreductase [Armatimonadota bacterium]
MSNLHVLSLFAAAAFLLPSSTSAVEDFMANQSIPLSIAPNGVEAVAVSPTAIDIYLPTSHNGAIIERDGVCISVAPGTRKISDTGLSPATVYLYSIIVEGDPATVAEQTFPALSETGAYDVVVVGATASGTAAAVSVARLGVSVALIEETNRAGGMASNGLGVTDMRQKGRSNGFFEEFRARVARYYGRGENGLRYEPRVANAIMKSMIYAEPRIIFFRRMRTSGVYVRDGRIQGVRLKSLDSLDESDVIGRLVIDATVEADVAAAAGVKFRIPREVRTPEEPHAGVIYYDNNTDEILPGSTGEADHRIQSYAYLLTVKDYPGEDRSIPEPAEYDVKNYIYSPSWEESWAFNHGRLPNGKYELNQHPWGGDLPGINYDYPQADAALRQEIAERYLWRALGYLYYLQTTLGMKSLGLADDEYPDTGGLPHSLYVREARRMIGISEMNESDVIYARERRFHDSIAIGDYPMDSHATQELRDPTAGHRGEGEWWLVRHTPWYRVPIGVIIPRDVDGLIVSTAVSATHVAYGTLRMEPVRMSLGQAAGTIAALALRYSMEPREVPAAIVQDRLLLQKAYLTWFADVHKSTRHFRAIQFLAVRGFFDGEEFRPEEYLTREEAGGLMEHLVQDEKSGPSAPAALPPDGGTPIGRVEFARLLVAAKSQIDPDWIPRSVESSHYADLSPGTQAAAYAETLYRHRIDTRGWAGPPSRSADGLLFHPDSPITRADAAQAIWLAHRAAALRLNR